VLTARLAYEFPRFLPHQRVAGASSDTVATLIQSPKALNALEHTNPALHEGIIQAYSHAIDRMFLVAVPISILGIVAALFIKQVRLRDDEPAPTAAAVEIPGGVH
jgi:hypothetical protein